MADRSFGVREINIVGSAGTPTISSPNNINLNGNNVAISTDLQVGRNVSVAGSVSIASSAFFDTRSEAVFGDDSTFKIYHDGTHSYITCDGGNLKIQSTNLDDIQILNDQQTSIVKTDFSAYSAKFKPSTSVDLYYGGSKKFETTNTGANVTGGITFNGDTAAANHLDDYEEGSFTPVLSFAGGTTGITYSMQEGHYTKIGRQVIAQFRIQLTSEGSSTGTLRISLPFTALNTFSQTGVDGNIFMGYSSGFTQAQIGDNPVSGYVGGGTNYVIFNARRSTGDAVTLNQTDVDDDLSISCTAFYHAT